ncbi:MAG: CoA transferase [Actinobacteria bacterium]|nr:CoA transferase [Actinomycetota bacterium]
MLVGVRVLDTSTVGPGSRCSAWLADLGADVIKVGRLSGGIEPVWHAYGAGRGTRQVRIDLQDERGVGAFLALVATADVVLDSYRPGVADRLGVGYDACRSANPAIVYAAPTGYGQDGPYADWAGHDLNYLAVAGFLGAQGRRADGAPTIPGATVADSAGGGMHAAMSILAALLRRERTGEGAYLDVSATEGVLSLMSLHVDEALAAGAEPGPGSNVLLGRYACYDVYRCADDRFVAVGAIEARFFANLVRLLELPEELAAAQYDEERQDELRAALSERFATKDRGEWVAQLAPHDTCVAPVLAVSEVPDDPHLAARGAFGAAIHPEHGTVRQVAAVIAGAVRSTEPMPTRVGTQTREVLAEAGVDDLDTLFEQGVVA